MLIIRSLNLQGNQNTALDLLWSRNPHSPSLPLLKSCPADKIQVSVISTHSRAVVLESGLKTFFYRLGLVLDSLVFGLGLVSDLVMGLAKCCSWSRPSPAMYAFFSFKTKPLIWLACSANG